MWYLGVLMVMTLDLSDDLAAQLQHRREDLPRILELGLREITAAEEPGFKGMAEVLETLATLPTPREVLALRPSRVLEERIETLLAKNRSGGLSPGEEREWDRYQYMEHLVRLAKAKALAALNRPSP